VHARGSRHHHVVNLRTPGEVDEEVRGWLRKAFDEAGR